MLTVDKHCTTLNPKSYFTLARAEKVISQVLSLSVHTDTRAHIARASIRRHSRWKRLARWLARVNWWKKVNF